MTTSEKRLFVVGANQHRRYFTNKMEAKEYRNTLIKNGVHCWVSRGPDHMGPHGTKITNREHRSNRAIGDRVGTGYVRTVRKGGE